MQDCAEMCAERKIDMTQEKIKEIIEKHALWLKNDESGEQANLYRAKLSRANLYRANLFRADLSMANLSKANLSRANLSGADLSWANLSRADLSGADLSWANLSRADLSGADLYRADLSGADLSGADLSGANLYRADLSGANLSGADLSGANLSGADLSGANLSGVKNLISSINFLESNFERVDDGYIAYKTFGITYKTPESWKIEANSIIEETVNPDRCTTCGSGINVAPLNWVKKNYGSKGNQIWKCLIKWEWLPGVIVPYMSDGKIRCERVQLLEIVGGEE
jgi:hypothetical protein